MKTLVRALVLAAISAVTAEFLLGDQWLGGAAPIPQQIGELLLFMAFYGSAAVLIREIARRTGRGWPTMLLFAFAFGVIEEGIVDQTLFNPDYIGHHLLAFGYIPGIGLGGPWTIFVLTLHVVWSMGAPIALAEALFPVPFAARKPRATQRQAPWLGTAGIVIAIVLYLLGAAAIFTTSLASGGFLATWWQMGLAALVAAAAIVVALRLRPRMPRPGGAVLPALIVGFVGTSLFQLIDDIPHSVSPWLVCLAMLVVLAAGLALSVRFRLDVFGLAAGAIATYCWLGLTKALPLGGFPAVEQCVLVAAMLAVLLRAAVIHRRSTLPRSSVATQRVAS